MVLKPLTDEEIAVLQGHAEVAAARFGAEELCGVPASQLTRLLDFAERAKKLLGEIDTNLSGDESSHCPNPACGSPIGRGARHQFGCELAALIGKP